MVQDFYICEIWFSYNSSLKLTTLSSERKTVYAGTRKERKERERDKEMECGRKRERGRVRMREE